MAFEFQIGETVKDTGSFGTVIVKDIFVSTTNPVWHCYRVETVVDDDGGTQSFLTDEETLLDNAANNAANGVDNAE